jgi:hypothetical protein
MPCLEARNERRAQGDHPEPAQLQRFFRGELARDETSALVRHLLTGCPRCRQETRRLWGLGDPPRRGPKT